METRKVACRGYAQYEPNRKKRAHHEPKLTVADLAEITGDNVNALYKIIQRDPNAPDYTVIKTMKLYDRVELMNWYKQLGRVV